MNEEQKKQKSTALPAEENKSLRRRSYVKLSMVFLILLIVIAFGSIAWFTMNREAEGSGTQMAAVDFPFELRTEGEGVGGDNAVSGGFGTLFNLLSSTFHDDYVINSEAESGVNFTDNSTTRIRWTFDDTDSGEGIAPGSCGKLTFYVVPKESGTLQVTFDLTMEGYYSENRTLTDRNDDLRIYQVPDLTKITSSSDADYREALEFLNGHILYFQDAEEVTANGKTTYRNFTGLIDGRFTKSTWTNDSLTVTKDEPEEVNIYWIWPNTFSEMAFAQGDSGLTGSMRAVAGDNDTHDEITAFIRSNTTNDTNRIFRGSDTYSSLINQPDPSAQSGGEGEEPALLDLSSSNLTTAQIVTLSDGYNNADSAIGSRIQYMLFVLTAY